MKRARGFGWAVGCAVLLAFAAGIEASDAVKTIVGSYLEIHARLAADKIDGIKAPAAAIVKQAESMGGSGAAIAKAATAVGGATDLKSARDAFGPLSDAVIAAAVAAGPAAMKELGVRQAFCPMVHRGWLQKDDKIRNPYYGSTMLECGEFKK